MKRYDQVYAEIGLPADFVLDETSNYDLVVYPAGGRYDFVVDDNEGFTYRKNKIRSNGIYLRCIACKATRVLHLHDNQVLLCLFLSFVENGEIG